MEKLVLQEIWSDFPAAKIKKPYCYIITIAVAAIGIVLLSSISADKNVLIVSIFIILSNSMLKSNISDCIYIIPISMVKYIIARYRITVIMELSMYGAVEALRYIICIISDEGISHVFILEQLFVSAAFILYILIKNTWLLYVNFGLKEMQTYKIAQGLSLIWLFCIIVIADIADEKITETVPLLLLLTAVGGFIAYAVYICVYVKKNLIIKTFKQ